MPAVSWPLACCRVNLQWATSPMKQEKCDPDRRCQRWILFKRGWRGYLLAGWRVTLREWASWNKQNAPCFVKSSY